MFDLSQTRDARAQDAALRRPRLLMRAAIAGLASYDRSRDLRRLLAGALPSPKEALARLAAAEEQQEERRLRDSASYSPQHQVALLTAILGERHLVKAAEAEARGPVPQRETPVLTVARQG